MSHLVPAILPYTLLKIDDTPTLVFLLWRDRRSTATESSTFWGPVVCPLGKDDKSPLDAVCRAFSEKTKGQFAPATMTYDNEHELETVTRKSPAKQRIEESRISLRKKLKAGNGVTLLSIRQYVTYVAPVRFIAPEQLSSSFGSDKGETEWVSAQDLFAALYSSVPDNIVTVSGKPYQSATAKAERNVQLPLVLPFTVAMRSQEARNEIAAILKQFNVPLPVETAAAAGESSSATAAAAAVPDLSSLSLHNQDASAAAASAAPAATAAPAASSSPAADAPAATTNYTCRKCRTVLFTDLCLNTHTLPKDGGGKFAHKHIPMSQGGRRINTECGSLFVDPHMLGVDYPEGEGPMLCAKCNTRYGNYVWSGGQCSCGEWIIPCFQVPKSKVDERPTAGRNVTNHIQFQFQRPPPRGPPQAAAAATPATAAATEATQPAT